MSDELARVKRIGRETGLNDDDMVTLRRAFKESEDRAADWKAACQTNERLLEQNAETLRLNTNDIATLWRELHLATELRAQNAELLAALRSIIEWTEEEMSGKTGRLERYIRRELLIRNAARAAINSATQGSAP